MKGEADNSAKQSPPQRQPIATSKPSQSKDAARQRRKYIKRRRYSYSRWTDPQVIVNGILAVGAIAGLVLYYCQLRQQIESTRAAMEATDLAKRSIQQVERNSHLDQRAWVSVKEVKGFPKPGEQFRVTVVLTNSGKTVARHLKVVAGGSEKHDAGGEPNFTEEIKAHAKGIIDAKRISDAILAPNAGVETTAIPKEKDLKVSATDFDNLKIAVSNRTFKFFMLGQVTYEDIFR
jgi:hypothetical protein